MLIVGLSICALALAPAERGVSRSVVVSFSPPVSSDAVLTLTSQDDPDLPPERVSVPRGTESLPIHVAPDVLELRLTSESDWHAPRYLLASESSVELFLHAKSAVRGRWRADGELNALQLILTPPESTIRLTIPCDVGPDTFACEGPAGVFDGRLEARGFLPTDWTRIELSATDPVELGKVTLRRGQSISASVTGPRGVQLDRTVVFAEPINAGVAVKGRPDARGRVPITGVRSGAYALHAIHPDGFRSQRLSLVVEDSDVIPPEALVLQPPARVRVHVDPPLTSTGASWEVRLSGRGAKRDAEAAAAAVSSSGTWSSAPLFAGSYDLSIVDPGTGDVCSREVIEMSGADVDRSITVELRKVKGVLKRGGDPLRASLTFSNDQGASATVNSNLDGSFVVGLPSRTEAWSVNVSDASIDLSRTLLVRLPAGDDPLLLDLASAAIAGVVVDENSKPVQGAVVDTVGDSLTLPFAQVVSGEDGRFRLQSVPDGQYRLVAHGGTSGQSDATDVVVSDQMDAQVVIVVRRAREFRVRVVSSTGPVPGARVQVVPRDVWVSAHHTYTTNEQGTVTAKIPASVNMLDLLVAPPGFSFTTAHVAYRPEVLSILVTQNGGTLTLDQGVAEPSARLWHDGAAIHLQGALRYEWPSHVASNAMTIPKMEPGVYRYCTSRGCAEGFLPPNGELFLPGPDGASRSHHPR